MASHILKSRLVAGDLDKLNSTQHGNPNQLENDPDVEDQGKGVTRDVVTERVVNDATFRASGRRHIGNVYGYCLAR